MKELDLNKYVFKSFAAPWWKMLWVKLVGKKRTVGNVTYYEYKNCKYVTCVIAEKDGSNET